MSRFVVGEVRNNVSLPNAGTVLLEQFNRLDPKLQQLTLVQVQTYNSP